MLNLLEIAKCALTGVAQLVGHRPAKQKVAGSIPSQGTCLGFGPVTCGATKETTD